MLINPLEIPASTLGDRCTRSNPLDSESPSTEEARHKTRLDFKLRDVLPHLRDNGRLNVLIDLVLRGNERQRCWPSVRRIAKDTGYALEAVNKAKAWLLQHGALRLIPYDERMGDECDLPTRQHVYELTGVLIINGVRYPYLYDSAAEISVSEVSSVESKVVKDSKLVQKEKKRESAPVARAATSTSQSISITAPDGDSRSEDEISENDSSPQTDFAVKAQTISLSQPSHEVQNGKGLPQSNGEPRATPAPAGMRQVIAYGFNNGTGGLAGRLSSFFAGTLRDHPRQHAWYQIQPSERPATPQEIVALALWYSRNPDYSKSYAERKGLPKTPSVLRERLDEFRGSVGYDKAMTLAGPILERLLRGEMLRPEPVSEVRVSTQTMPQRVEAAQAYRPISPVRDAAYQDRRQAGDLELAAKLFGP